MIINEKIQDITFPDYLSKHRRPVDPPDYAVKNGVPTFGTFTKAFKHVNFNDCFKPCGKKMPDFLKPFRLKQWFAYLIDFDRGFILSAVYDTGPIRFNVVSFFNKETRKSQSNMVFTTKKKGIFPDTLIDSKIHLKAGNFSQEINNNLESGQIAITTHCPENTRTFNYHADIKLNSISMPSVVVMPLGENRPLYIHKELFSVVGAITIEDQTFKLDDKAICAIDDHKGYYPYHMEYDWISGFKNDEKGPIAFNLVDNQVLNPDDYNENFIWVKGEMHPVPPIKVIKQTDRLWVAKDKHGAVDLRFDIEDDFVKKVNAPLFKADYRAPYGTISGYMKDLEGHKISLNGMFGVGEDLDYKY